MNVGPEVRTEDEDDRNGRVALGVSMLQPHANHHLQSGLLGCYGAGSTVAVRQT